MKGEVDKIGMATVHAPANARDTVIRRPDVVVETDQRGRSNKRRKARSRNSPSARYPGQFGPPAVSPKPDMMPSTSPRQT